MMRINYSWIGRSVEPGAQGARELQCTLAAGLAPGSSLSEPAGRTTFRPLRVRCGPGESYSDVILRQAAQRSGLAYQFGVSSSAPLIPFEMFHGFPAEV
jgi:hypothetical protein